jgi:hypothetical protein
MAHRALISQLWYYSSTRLFAFYSGLNPARFRFLEDSGRYIRRSLESDTSATFDVMPVAVYLYRSTNQQPNKDRSTAFFVYWP